MNRARVLLLTAAVAWGAPGCGGDEPATNQTPSPTSTTADAAEQRATTQAAAAKRRADRRRRRDVERYLRTEEMTPSDLYQKGISAPEPLRDVYSVRRVAVNGADLTIATALAPEPENANEMSGVCNQIVTSSRFSWIKTIEVRGSDGQTHATWTDADQDGTDDDTQLIACQDDLG